MFQASFLCSLSYCCLCPFCRNLCHLRHQRLVICSQNHHCCFFVKSRPRHRLWIIESTWGNAQQFVLLHLKEFNSLIRLTNTLHTDDPLFFWFSNYVGRFRHFILRAAFFQAGKRCMNYILDSTQYNRGRTKSRIRFPQTSRTTRSM